MAPSVATRRPRRSSSVRKRSRSARADREDLAKLVVRDGDSQAGAAGGAVLDPAQADVEVAARGGRVEGREADLHEARNAAESVGEELRDLDIEADDARGVGRIGFDERRAAFGVTTPAQFLARLGSDGRREHRHARDDREMTG